MENALIVCDSPKGTEFYRSFLSQNNFRDITVATDPDEGRRRFEEREYDLCLINAPFKNESGEQLSVEIGERNTSQVVLLVPVEFIEQITQKVEGAGVITVGKPINKTLLLNAIRLAEVIQLRVDMIRKENRKLKKKLDEMKVISRAKCILVATLGVDEEGAHRYIEKMAMDERMTKFEVAGEVIERFG